MCNVAFLVFVESFLCMTCMWNAQKVKNTIMVYWGFRTKMKMHATTLDIRQAGKYTLGELRADEQTQRPERFHKQYKWKMVL